MKLICIPFAGGSSVVFSKWHRLLSEDIEILNIELAGRGRRFQEKCYDNVEEAVDDIYQIVLPVLTGEEPYAIFGHSMGSLLAFELCHRIQEYNHRLPVAVFFSAKSAPHLPPKEQVHLFEKERFIEKVFSLGGTPEQLLNNRDLLDLYLPSIRADYKLVETYKFQKRSNLLNIPFYVFYGDEDDIKIDEMQGWKIHTSQTCRWYEFKGGHFFIQPQENRVVTLIDDILSNQFVRNR
ncbi:thioesterase [Lysinibacillus alkalisoli]|uniref:Thioesterase n=1 Tax=Lysinibacillus alkalisoli TaxID=1911548 RepID=A0A917GAU1_9BACI|nr:alpha/beta fold hydrolase [Lysinibacillus alkalisoli]GGG33682.1 thioesterase [Lysinibacillus alkalisoli]